jgi:acyl-CoA thioesterase I
MPILLSSSSHVLFIGDSITDCGRMSLLRPLGDGYVSLIGRRLKKTVPDCRITNRGVSGDRAVDLAARWKEDCLDIKPTVVSLLVGINDTWRRYDQGQETPIDEFEEHVRDLLNRVVTALGAELVIAEPFLLPMSEEQKLWSLDLNPKRRLLRGLADEYGATFVPLQEEFSKMAATVGAAALVSDGVHPTRKGHELIAGRWLAQVAAQQPAYS